MFVCSVNSEQTILLLSNYRILPAPQIQEKLYEDIVSYYGRLYHLSPLSAKIYAFLVFDFSREGVCFDFLVKELKASKSSVSNSLKMLEKAQLIKYTFKLDSRLRLYSLNPEYLFTRFTTLIHNMDKEKTILKGLVGAKEKSKLVNQKLDKVFQLYIELLDKNISLVQHTMKKLEKIK